MSQKHYQYMIPKGVSLGAVKARLKQSVDLTQEPTVNLQRTYYDTFDWRVYGKGETLECEFGENKPSLYLRSLDTGELFYSQKIDHMPKFAWDLPHTSLRKHLDSLLEMRALLPQAKISGKIHLLKALDKRRKTVARVHLEEINVMAPEEEKSHVLGKIINVLPVRGYDKAAQHIIKIIEDELELEPTQDNFLLTTLNVLGRKPGTYTSKLNLHLNPDMRADEATKIVLHRLLDTMEENEVGTREDIDSEFLHDFRVAVRRTRSALGQIKGVIPQKILDRFRPEFAWLGQITGPTRDMDVYLLKFDDYQNSLPVSVQKDLEPLRSFLQEHQKIEQQTLAKAISSSRYRKLINGWRTFLETAAPKRSTLPNAVRPIKEVANERIWRVYRRVLKEGGAITPETAAEHLHELRKTCKKLRYLMEFFQSLYPSNEIKALIKVLKILQDNLGDFQDYEVQVTTLKHFSHQMMEEGKTPAETFMAMGILVESLDKRQHETREEFAARFEQFASADHQKHFKGLFGYKTPEALAS